MTPTQYAERCFPPDQDRLLPASHDWNLIREQVADAIRTAIADTRRTLIPLPDYDALRPGQFRRSYTLQCGICGFTVTYVTQHQVSAEGMARIDGWMKSELAGWRCPHRHDGQGAGQP